MSSELVLTGIDGKNPLGFLAALGVLNAVADNVKRDPPKLQWRSMGTWRPVLIGGPNRGTLNEMLLADAASFANESALDLRYRKGGDGVEAHDLKPPPAHYINEYLKPLARNGSARSLAFASAFATDVAVDNNGNTKPTALHFTAGQQEFLSMVSDLRRGVTTEDFEEAVFGPWQYARSLPVLQWDNSQSRDYALRARDPSKEKKLGVPGADWLAFRGLPFIRVAPRRNEIVTTGCGGGWKTGFFRWPIWTASIPREVVGALLTSRDVFIADPRAMRARGVAIVFQASINRSDQGGYGGFSPASVARPKKID